MCGIYLVIYVLFDDSNSQSLSSKDRPPVRVDLPSESMLHCRARIRFHGLSRNSNRSFSALHPGEQRVVTLPNAYTSYYLITGHFSQDLAIICETWTCYRNGSRSYLRPSYSRL